MMSGCSSVGVAGLEDSSGLRRSSSHQSSLVQPDRRGKSSHGADPKVVITAADVSAMADTKSPKTSPPKAFRVLPVSFSAPPTPRRPTRTPRLSPRVGLVTGSQGNRLLTAGQDDRRRRRASATDVNVAVALFEPPLRRSSSAYLSESAAGQLTGTQSQEGRVPKGFPMVAPPVPTVGQAFVDNGADCDHPAAQNSLHSLSGTTTPTEGGGDNTSLSQSNRAKSAAGSAQQAPDSRIMRLIGKRSVIARSLTASEASLVSITQPKGRLKQRFQGTSEGMVSRSVPYGGAALAPENAHSPKLTARPLTRQSVTQTLASEPTLQASAVSIALAMRQSSISRTEAAIEEALPKSYGSTPKTSSGAVVLPTSPDKDSSLAARATAAVADAKMQAAHGAETAPIQTPAVEGDSGDELHGSVALPTLQREEESNLDGDEYSQASDHTEAELDISNAYRPTPVKTESAGDLGHAIIWHGCSSVGAAGGAEQAYQSGAFAHQTAEPQRSPPFEAAVTSCFVGEVAQPSPQHGVQHWLPPELPLLQNEAGSLVVPQTWRYVPPPLECQPRRPSAPSAASIAAEAPAAVSASRSCSSTAPVGVEGDKREAEDEDGEEEEILPLDTAAKQALLDDIVEHLMARADGCQQELSQEQRANRALKMALEVEQRKTAMLQQQLAWMAHHAGYQYASVEDGSHADVALQPEGHENGHLAVSSPGTEMLLQ